MPIPPDAIDLDHVAVAVERWADAFPRYAGDLAGRWLAGGGGVGFASCQFAYANGMKLEVLEPSQVEVNDFLRRFLDRNGPGPHHLTYKVADIVAALAAAEEAGYRPVNVQLDDPDWKEAFLHPKDIPGVVVQLAQSSGSWTSPPHDGLPAPRTSEPATLLHVAHAVRSLDEGLRLFAGLLAGAPVDEGKDDEGRWVELAWKGPGRVRLVEPYPGAAADEWVGERAGRVLALAFAAPSPAAVPGARPATEGWCEVPPEENLGVRLRVCPAVS